MTPWVLRLIGLNVAMFFIQSTLPGIEPLLGFNPTRALVQPWTFLTYMFLHSRGGLSHILFNMIGLYFFGSRVEGMMGGKRFLALYFISGFTGALVSLFFYRNGLVIGASAGVFGVMMAFAHYWPRERIYIWMILPIEARVLVILTTLAALWSGLGGSRGGVADFAHLGGYAGAFAYLKWLDRMAGAKNFRKRRVEAVPKDALLNWKRIDSSRVHEVNREELDRILDKISRHGQNGLTPTERAFLMNFVPKDDRPVS